MRAPLVQRRSWDRRTGNLFVNWRGRHGDDDDAKEKRTNKPHDKTNVRKQPLFGFGCEELGSGGGVMDLTTPSSATGPRDAWIATWTGWPAKFFLQEQIAKGKKHPTAVCALAFNWQRIRCNAVVRRGDAADAAWPMSNG